MERARLAAFGFVFLLSGLFNAQARAVQEPPLSLPAPTERMIDASDIGDLPATLPPGILSLTTIAAGAPVRHQDSKPSGFRPPHAHFPLDPKQEARLFFEQMSHDRKRRVEITLQNGTRLEGRVISTHDDQVTIRIASTKQKTSVNFDDLLDWRIVPTSGEIARNVLAVAGMGLLRIAMLPLFVLAALSGWDGC